MLVQTYEVEVEQHPEACEESARLIESLGLTGQAKTTFGADRVRVPYRVWSEHERMVFSILLTNHETVERYSAGPIPLRVLQVLEHAQSLDFFGGYEVWHNAALPDPILLAWEPGRQYGNDKYLLARWGESLDEMPALAAQAAQINTARAIEACDKGLAELTAYRASLSALTTPSLSVNVPYVSVTR